MPITGQESYRVKGCGTYPRSVKEKKDRLSISHLIKVFRRQLWYLITSDGCEESQEGEQQFHLVSNWRNLLGLRVVVGHPSARERNRFTGWFVESWFVNYCIQVLGGVSVYLLSVPFE